MKNIVKGLEESIEANNWYGALFISLTIPDICSKIESPNENTNVRYPRWFEQYRHSSYEKHLSGRDCYALRCTLLHEGSQTIETQRIKETIDHFTFSGKGSHLISFSGVFVGSDDDGKNSCHLSTHQFSLDMINSYKDWLESNSTNSELLKRLELTLEIKDANSLYGGSVIISD